MITVIQILALLACMILPLFKTPKAKVKRPVVYKNNHDTTDAHYAINNNGCLEEIVSSKVQRGYID